MSWFVGLCVCVALTCIADAEHLMLNGRKLSATNNQGSGVSFLLKRLLSSKGSESIFKQKAEGRSYIEPLFPSPSDRMNLNLFINRQLNDAISTDTTSPGTYVTDQWTTSTPFPTSTQPWTTATSFPTSTPVETYETEPWTTATSFSTSAPVGTFETELWTTSTSFPTSTPVGTYETDQWTTATSFPTSTSEATTPAEACEDVTGFCKFLLKNRYGKNLEKFCERYGEDCCETCSEEKCVDVGYYGRSCKTLRRVFGNVRDMCKYFEGECCESCSRIGDSNEDDEDSDEDNGGKGNQHSNGSEGKGRNG